MERERFPGKVVALPCKGARAAAEEARKHTDGPLAVSMWSDGSKLDSERTQAGVTWKHQQEWKTSRVYLGSNKEVFNTELYIIAEAPDVTLG